MQAIKTCAAHVVFVHSHQDSLVLPKHSKELYARVRDRAVMVEITGSHSDMRSVAVIEKIIEELDVCGVLALEKTELEGEIEGIGEKLTHSRNRTEFHSGSYSEIAFRSALQELVNH